MVKAGAVESGLLHRTTEGSPQGGVISPCLSNVFLHHVLDDWFERQVRPRLKGASTLVRFADDAVMAFDIIIDAKRVLAVLDKRFARYGLTLHTDDTPHRLPPAKDRGHAASGDGWNRLRLSRPHPCLGTVAERQGHGSASHGQEPLCPRCGRSERLVSAPPALVYLRPAPPSVYADAGPLRLLRRRRQQSTTALVRYQSCSDMEEMALSA